MGEVKSFGSRREQPEQQDEQQVDPGDHGIGFPVPGMVTPMEVPVYLTVDPRSLQALQEQLTAIFAQAFVDGIEQGGAVAFTDDDEDDEPAAAQPKATGGRIDTPLDDENSSWLGAGGCSAPGTLTLAPPGHDDPPVLSQQQLEDLAR